MTWTEFLNNSYLEYNGDLINIVSNDNWEIGCVVAVEDFDNPKFSGYWFKEHEGLPKPTKEEAEKAFKRVEEFLTTEGEEYEEPYDPRKNNNW